MMMVVVAAAAVVTQIKAVFTKRIETSPATYFPKPKDSGII
jgi:hypothetical protein